MKKIVIFLAFFISAECLAQNPNPNQNNNQVKPAGNAKVAQGAPKSDYRPPALTPEEKIQIEKNTAEQKEFEGILKKLTPEQNKKFQRVNQDF